MSGNNLTFTVVKVKKWPPKKAENKKVAIMERFDTTGIKINIEHKQIPQNIF